METNYLFVMDFSSKKDNVHLFKIDKNINSKTAEKYLTEKLNFDLENIQWMIKTDSKIIRH